MNISVLYYFMSIVETQNFGEAADLHYISASSLSKYIRSLEDELGVRLFDRNTRRVTLTDAGKKFLPFAQNTIEEHKKMLIEMKQFSDNSKKFIRLATIRMAFSYHIVAAILDFQNHFKDVTLFFHENISDQISDALINYSADFAITRTNFLDPNKFRMWPLVEDKMVAVVSKNRPLSKKELVSVSDFASYSSVPIPHKKSDLYKIYRNAYQSAGLKLPSSPYDNVTIDYATYFSLIGHDNVAGIFMEKALPPDLHPNLKIIPLKEQIISQTALVCLKEKQLSDYEYSFIEFLKTAKKNHVF